MKRKRVMERWSDPEQVFVKYSEVEVMKDNEKNQKETITCIYDKRIMTLFQVKCALLELFGEEITTVSRLRTLVDHRPPSYVICLKCDRLILKNHLKGYHLIGQ